MELSQYLDIYSFMLLFMILSIYYQLFYWFTYTYSWIEPTTYEGLYFLEIMYAFRLKEAWIVSKYLDVR